MGGNIQEREAKRYEILHVPALVRSRDREIGSGEPLLARYERICFEKPLIQVPGKPLAALVSPGHPLLQAVTDLILERHRDCLKLGAALVDDIDTSEAPRMLVYFEHAVEDGRVDAIGQRRVVSKRLQFVELFENGKARIAGPAPYLDYRAATEEERVALTPILSAGWLSSDVERRAITHAIANLVPEHLAEVESRKEALVSKTLAAVKDRLTKEIAYWDHRANELKEQELAGKTNARINSGKARQRADELQARLQRRTAELEQERHISALPPVSVGGALIIPAGLLARVKGLRKAAAQTFARETSRIELAAMSAVIKTEQRLGFEPSDVSKDRLGYDIESRVPGNGKLRFIEVKGRVNSAQTITVTKNEILTSFNKPDDFILALVEVPIDPEFTEGDAYRVAEPQPSYGNGCKVRYVRRPFQREPDFGVTSINYDLKELLARSQEPV